MSRKLIAFVHFDRASNFFPLEREMMLFVVDLNVNMNGREVYADLLTIKLHQSSVVHCICPVMCVFRINMRKSIN